MTVTARKSVGCISVSSNLSCLVEPSRAIQVNIVSYNLQENFMNNSDKITTILSAIESAILLLTTFGIVPVEVGGVGVGVLHLFSGYFTKGITKQ